MRKVRSTYSPLECHGVRVLATPFAGPISLLVLSCMFSGGLMAAESKRVTLVRTPDGGIQPQAAVDSRGVVHLIYYNGDAKKGDIFYVRQEPRQETFSRPIQVNT